MTDGLLNCEKINLCCFEPSSLWDFVTVAKKKKKSSGTFNKKTALLTLTILYITNRRYLRTMHIFSPKFILAVIYR